MNRPKQIGTAGESAVVKAMRTQGFPHAERVTMRGASDIGDIRLTPIGLTAGILAEVKAGKQTQKVSDAQLTAWMAETETERVHAGADVALLVTQRHGVGHAQAHRWWAFLSVATMARLTGGNPDLPHPAEPVRMLLGSALALLRTAGHGTPLPTDVQAADVPATAATSGASA